MDNELHIEDAEDFKNVELSIKQIALDHYNRCIQEGSKEMSQGGSRRKETRWGVFTIDVPNQQEIFINHVDQMLIIMNPFLEDNKEFKKGVDDIKNKIKESFEEGIKTKKELSGIKVDPNTRGSNISKEKALNRLESNFTTLKLESYQKILIVVSNLLNELNYFEEFEGK